MYVPAHPTHSFRARRPPLQRLKLMNPTVGYTPCHYAAFFGLRECAERLVQHGASLELRDRISKKTCMELAQERRHYSVVEYLSRVVNVTIPLLTVSLDL